MDELLKALADAVRSGTAYAMPALIGYYVVRVLEAAMFPLGLAWLAAIAGRTIRAGMTIYHEKNTAIWEAKRAAWKQERDTLNARRD